MAIKLLIVNMALEVIYIICNRQHFFRIIHQGNDQQTYFCENILN